MSEKVKAQNKYQFIKDGEIEVSIAEDLETGKEDSYIVWLTSDIEYLLKLMAPIITKDDDKEEALEIIIKRGFISLMEKINNDEYINSQIRKQITGKWLCVQ